MDKEVLKNLSYGVYIVSVFDGTKSTGCVANSIMQITYDTIAISLNHNNYTTEFAKKNKKLAVSILPTDINDDVIPVFGFSCGREVDKFKNIGKINIDGIDIIKDAIGYLLCEVVEIVETETHSVFIAKIKDAEMLNPKTPMTYAYYHTVKKGLSPKNAPTYIEETINNNELNYKCKICGYIYKGDITKEPDSYICPICKKPKEFFEKI